MKFIYNKEEYNKSNVDILIDKINSFYKNTFDTQQEKIKQSPFLILSDANEEYENIFSNYTSQIFDTIFYYSDFSKINN